MTRVRVYQGPAFSPRLTALTTMVITMLAAGLAPATLAAGPGTFSAPHLYAAGTNPHSVAIGDVNGDQRNDLVVANAHGDSVSILLGTGTGTFGAATSFSVGVRPKSVVLDDFNGDGFLDLATANQTPSTTSVLLGDGHGGFGPATDYPTCAHGHEITTGDFNEDTHRDLAVACWGSSSISILLGDGHGGFGTPIMILSGSAPHSLTVGHFNADGHDDIAVADHGEGAISILLGDGHGGFEPRVKYPVGSGPHSVRAGDFNSDGFADLAVANDASDTVSVLPGAGDGTFGPGTAYGAGSVPKGVAIADLDGDGHLDLLVSDTAGNGDGVTGHPGGDLVQLLRGRGDGSFYPAVALQTGQTPFAVVAGDFNGDGHPEVVTPNWDGNDVAVLLNLADSTPPLVSAPSVRIVRPSTEGATRTSAVRLSWTGSDAGAGLASFALGRSVDGGAMAVVANPGPTVRSYDTSVASGHLYRFAVRATDAAGNQSAWSGVASFSPGVYGETASLAKYSRYWAYRHNSGFISHRSKTSVHIGASVSFTFSGRAVGWVAQTGPGMGSAKVYVDGVYKGKVSLTASAWHNRQVVYDYAWAVAGKHSLKLILAGPSSHPRVDVDGLVVLH